MCGWFFSGYSRTNCLSRQRSENSIVDSFFQLGVLRWILKKMEAVQAWPVPENCKQLQRFVSFTNFYRHYWLEGQPFLVLTDHKNLEYLLSAKHLNSRQARYALFLARFNFSLSYWPGSKNENGADLSCRLDKPEQEKSPDFILPVSNRLGTTLLDIEQEVMDALKDTHTPSACLDSLLYVPDKLCSRVLDWYYSSQLASHPGINHTLFLVKQCFWWPTQ